MVSIFIMKLNGSRSKHMWLNRLWMNGNYYLFSYMFFITFSYFDLIWCNRPEGVCASVSLQPDWMNRFWWNFPEITCYIFAQYVFLRFWKFKFDYPMAAIFAVFGSGTLTFAILLKLSSNFMTWKGYSFLFYCYLKTGKLVDNFGSYGFTAFSKNIKNGRQKQVFEIGQVRCRFLLIRTSRQRVWMAAKNKFMKWCKLGVNSY